MLFRSLRSKASIIIYLGVANNGAGTVSNTAGIISPASNTLDIFAKCLTDKGAKFYGAYWCPHCNNQKKLFGDSIKYVTYVECAIEGSNDQVKECTDAGITGYPTWIINSKQYPGEQTFEKLAELTGCKL